MKTIKTVTLVSILLVGMTTSVFASWWNPFTWHWFKINTPATQQIKSDTDSVVQNISIQVASSTTEMVISSTSTILADYITQNEGKYPNKIKLFSNPIIVTRLKSVLSTEYDTMLKNWQVETPITKVSDLPGVYSITGIIAHSGGSYDTTIYFDTNMDIISVDITQYGSIKKYTEKRGSTAETGNRKSYTNTGKITALKNSKYGYTLEIPESYFIFETSPQYKKIQVTNGVSEKDDLIISPKKLQNEVWDYTVEESGLPWLRLGRENGAYFISGSKSVDDFWNKLAKKDDKGKIVNELVAKEKINNIDFIIYKQNNSGVLSFNALFMTRNNFFTLRSSPLVKYEEFYTIVKSVKSTN